MSDPLIVRPRLSFEEQFGQHRNWWVRDSRLTGNPLSVFLYLLSHEVSHSVTQTEAWTALGLGQRAWSTAKQVLLQCGFLVEVRDRYPDGYVDTSGNPRGRQRRFRLFLQDPEPGFQVPLSEAVIEVNEPYEEWLKTTQAPDTAQRSVGEESPVSPSLRSAVTESSTLHNAVSFIGRENQVRLVGYKNISNQPTNQTVSAREADGQVDAELADLHPDLRLTMQQIRHEVNDRVDLNTIDVVQAVRDTVLRAAERGQRIANPATYVASVIVRKPKAWAAGVAQPAPFEMRGVIDPAPSVVDQCRGDNHYWGPNSWHELDRANCVNCGIARRYFDVQFAELEDHAFEAGDR